MAHRSGSQVTSRGRACQRKLAANGFPSLVARSRLLLPVIASNRCRQRFSVYARSVRLATCGQAAEAAPKGRAIAHPRSPPAQAPRNPRTHLGADSSLEAAKAAFAAARRPPLAAALAATLPPASSPLPLSYASPPAHPSPSPPRPPDASPPSAASAHAASRVAVPADSRQSGGGR